MAEQKKTSDVMDKYGPDGQSQGLIPKHEQNGPDGRSIKSIESILFPEISANAARVLIGVASVLLDRQVAAQAAAFEKDGGFTERLYRTRQARRVP